LIAQRLVGEPGQLHNGFSNGRHQVLPLGDSVSCRFAKHASVARPAADPDDRYARAERVSPGAEGYHAAPDLRRSKRSRGLRQASLAFSIGARRGSNRFPRVADPAETGNDESKGDQGQYAGSEKKQLDREREIAGQADEPLVDRQPLLNPGVFAGEFVRGLLGWNELDDDCRILGSSFLLSGILRACLAGWLP